MSEARHTPGPWKPLRSCEDWDGFLWEPDDGDDRREMLARPFVRIEAKGGATVAAAHDLFEFNPADARLIAAAPDCYKVLADLVDYIDTEGHAPTAEVIREVCAEAIAKAQGE